MYHEIQKKYTMRLPNGYGSVYKLSGKRRKPYTARVTVGYEINMSTQKVRQKFKYIGYFETKKEALKALADYVEEPNKLPEKITLKELYEKWADINYPKNNISFKLRYCAAFNVLLPLKDLPFNTLNLDHFQQVFDDSGKNLPTLNNVKLLLRKLYDFAAMLEVVPPSKKGIIDYINLNNVGNPNKVEHKPFTENEIQKLWDLSADERSQVILIMIYTSMRIGEFINLKIEDVHLEDRFLYVGKAKTESGIRQIPIAEKIAPILKHWIDKNDEYIFKSSHLKYDSGTINYNQWNKIMNYLEMEHLPHDTRHTCVSLLTDAKVELIVIKKIVGHSSGDVTEDVYTHIDLKTKLNAINKI